MNIDFKNKSIPSPINILKKIFSHLDSVRKKELSLVIILSIFSSLAESISIAMLIPFISFFINPESYLINDYFKIFFNFFNLNNKKEILGTFSFIFILIVLISGFIKLKYLKISNKTTDIITSDFRVKIFNFLINQDFNYYFKHGSNEILSNLSQKTGAFTTVVFASINILNSILISLAIIVILIFNEPIYTPIIIICIGLFFFVIFKIKANLVLEKGQRVNLNQNFIIDIFENTVGYLPEIIIYNLKKFYSSVLNKISAETAKSTSDIRTISMSPRIYLEVFVIVFVVIFIYFSGIASRPTEVNIAYLAILAFGTQKILPLINNIYNLSISFKGSTPTVLTFLNILESGNKELIDDKDHETLKFNKSLSIEKISFNYNKDLKKVLNNFSTLINKGDKIALKGETGSGKSTLINIISGLLDSTEGKILVDGVQITKKNKKNWQKNISIVPQTTFLNNTSIYENIAIAQNLNKIDIIKVKKCAKLAHIDDFIESLPNKYKETVGERGVRLSGGQRQRIGIARALYRNSNLIIMDEPTNALDHATENLVMKSIMGLTNDITIIMISHSNNTLQFFDKIIDLNKLK